jgi:hypothetical protein
MMWTRMERTDRMTVVTALLASIVWFYYRGRKYI